MENLIDECLIRHNFNWFNMNKHFLSLYVHSKSKGRYSLLDVFGKIMDKTMMNMQCMIDWNRYSKNIYNMTQNWKKPRYPIDPISYIIPHTTPRNILNFLYSHNYTIEEFFSSLTPVVDYPQLLADAMRIFTEIHYYLDNPFCRRTPSSAMSHFCPVSSLTLRYFFNWDDFLVSLLSLNHTKSEAP